MEAVRGRMGEMNIVMEDIKSEKYALRNPVTACQEEYVKSLYLKMLCTVVQYENTPTEMQMLYLKRILKGIQTGETTEDCMRKALEIESSDMREFINAMQYNKTKCFFALEGLLLAGMGNHSRGNYEYLAELIGLLDISQSKLECLCQVAKSVLQQQTAAFDNAKTLMGRKMKKLDFLPYMREYYVGAVVDLDTRKHYYAPDLEASREMELPSEYRNCDVSFENLAIDMTKGRWLFDHCGEVRFQNCQIEGGKYVIMMSRVKRVVIVNCVFRHFTDRVLEMEQGEELEIVGSEFLSCGCTMEEISSYDVGGGVLYINNSLLNHVDLRSVLLKDNVFRKCYVASKNIGYVERMGIIASYYDGYTTTKKVAKLSLIRNEFSECGCHNLVSASCNTGITMLYNLQGEEEIIEGNIGMEDIRKLTEEEVGQ